MRCNIAPSTPPLLVLQALEVLVLLASLRRSLFSSDEERQAFLSRLMRGTLHVLQVRYISIIPLNLPRGFQRFGFERNLARATSALYRYLSIPSNLPRGQRNRLAWPHRRRGLASDAIRYAGAQSSVGRRFRSATKLRSKRYGGVLFLLQQRSKHLREMVITPNASTSNFVIGALFSRTRKCDRNDASSMVTAGATANTTEGNSRASKESELLCSHSHATEMMPRPWL